MVTAIEEQTGAVMLCWIWTGTYFSAFIAKLLTGKCLVWVLLCSFISGHAGVFGTRLEQNNRNTYQKDWETDTVVLSGCHGGGFLTSLD